MFCTRKIAYVPGPVFWQIAQGKVYDIDGDGYHSYIPLTTVNMLWGAFILMVKAIYAMLWCIK